MYDLWFSHNDQDIHISYSTRLKWSRTLLFMKEEKYTCVKIQGCIVEASYSYSHHKGCKKQRIWCAQQAHLVMNGQLNVFYVNTNM